MIIPQEDLRKMQLLQLDMLVEMDRVCRENNISYVITSGTLLGAVRHRGYIPWDDDADINMLREDYEKFKRVANQMNPDICFFQDHTTDHDYRWGYGKIRRTGTTYIRLGQEHLKGKNGVFIDVFPLDDIPKGTIGVYVQNALCYIARKITYSEVGRVQEKGFLKAWYTLLSHVPIDAAFALFNIYSQRSRNDSTNRVRMLSYGKIHEHVDKYSGGKAVFGRPKEWVQEVKDYEFEGFNLLGPIEADLFLSRAYGNDFMTPPPPEKRNQNSPCSSYSFGEAEPIYYRKKS